MNSDMHRWIKREGIKYFKKMGITTGQVIVDFGCNTGHYSVPAAKAIGPEGTVYAIDQDSSAIDQLKKSAQEEGLCNIVPIVSNRLTDDIEKGEVINFKKSTNQP
jgi:precorrin-6B methylase 2